MVRSDLQKKNVFKNKTECQMVIQTHDMTEISE